MHTNKTYEFSTIQELIDRVPADRIPLCLEELGKVYSVAKATAQIALNMAGVTEPQPRLIELNGPVQWIDDGKGELGFQLNSESGKELASTMIAKDGLSTNGLYPTGIELEVCRDITDRQRVGIRKYGVSVEDNPLSLYAWARHSYEEGLDRAVYDRRMMREIASLPDRIACALRKEFPQLKDLVFEHIICDIVNPITPGGKESDVPA